MNRCEMIEWSKEYKNEKDKSIGDLVIVFGNPEKEKVRKFLKLNECVMILETCLNRFEKDKQGQELKERFESCFLECYNQLERVRPSADSSFQPFSSLS